MRRAGRDGKDEQKTSALVAVTDVAGHRGTRCQYPPGAARKLQSRCPAPGGGAKQAGALHQISLLSSFLQQGRHGRLRAAPEIGSEPAVREWKLWARTRGRWHAFTEGSRSSCRRRKGLQDIESGQQQHRLIQAG